MVVSQSYYQINQYSPAMKMELSMVFNEIILKR